MAAPTFRLVRDVPGFSKPVPVASGFVTPEQAKIWLAKTLSGEAARGVYVEQVEGSTRGYEVVERRVGA